ncbi:flavin reductase family protein [Nocardiopsis baichengensis]
MSADRGSAHRAVAEAPRTRWNGTRTAAAPFGPRDFREALGRFPTGVVAVAARDPRTGRPVGLAANSFTSVSLEPPLVGFCVGRASTSWPALRAASRLAVSILGADQEEASLRLAAKGGDKFAEVPWHESPSGAPVIEGAQAWLECEVDAEHPAGDHVIVVARVHHLAAREGRSPLVYYRSEYRRLDD